MKQKIDINTVNRIRYEQPLYRIDHSIFQKEYKRADQLLYDFLMTYGKNSSRLLAEDEQIPNVISFLGARGRGKTSAMLSFLFSLNELHSEENEWSNFKKNNKNVKFVRLPYIDAAILSENEYILDVVLARMWDEFQKKVQEALNASNNALYMHLQQHVKTGFADVRKAYWVLKRKENKDIGKDGADEPTAGALHELSVSMNLRNKLKELVENYIKLLTFHQDEWEPAEYTGPCYLVLAIDDIDMSAKEAHHILEEVRRFFSIPQVIVFLTADFVRLQKMCESYFYSCLGNRAWDENSMYTFVNDYLGKILPYNMRIHMPELQENFDGYEIIKNIDKEKWSGYKLDKLDEKGLIISVIRDKCGICFDGVRRKRHFLQNSSLREMANYFERLFHVGDGQYSAWLKTDLKDRLVRRIGNEKQRVLMERLCSTDYEDMNRAVISFMKKNLDGGQTVRTSDKSLGQVLYVCSLAEESDAENREFINCILCLYSIMLAQIEDKEELREKIIGNSLFGEWEYGALPAGVPGRDVLTGFDARNRLELTFSSRVLEWINAKDPEQAADLLFWNESAKIQAWLYSLLFVNLSSLNAGQMEFALKDNDKLADVISSMNASSDASENTSENLRNTFSDSMDDRTGQENGPDKMKNLTGINQQDSSMLTEATPQLWIQIHGIARKSCFGFLHKNEQEEIEKLSEALKGMIKRVVVKIFGYCGQTAAEEKVQRTCERNYSRIWEPVERKRQEVEPFPVQNVEILYSIGKELEKVIIEDDGKSPVHLFVKMTQEYDVIAAELAKRDEYYKSIGMDTGFADNFRKRMRARIFLEDNYLRPGVKEAFIRQFANMYLAAIVRLQDPNK